MYTVGDDLSDALMRSDSVALIVGSFLSFGLCGEHKRMDKSMK